MTQKPRARGPATAPQAGSPTPGRSPGPAPAEGAFEASVERLAQIVERLEGGELPLEESLTLFEEGVVLARSAQARLAAAEQRVEQLLGEHPDGTPATVPFEDEDDAP